MVRPYFLPLLLVLSSCAFGAVTIQDRTHSVFNGDLSVIDYEGIRILLAQAPQGIQIQSSMDLKDHSRLIAPYTQIVSMITALHPQPLEAYNMGLGGGALPHFHLAQYPAAHVDSAEIDTAIIQLAKKYFFVTEDRHAILEGDAYATLARGTKKYDVIWMDEFTPKEGPKATVPAQYLQILRDHLKPDGILIVHLGMAKNPKTFEQTIRDYRENFVTGIHVRGPSAGVGSQTGYDFTPALKATAIALDQHDHDEAQALPEQVIAVSNSKSLSCARFWEVQKKWAKEKRIDLQWAESARAPSCQELTR